MRPTQTPWRKAAVLAALAVLASGAAAHAQGAPGDPYEPLNRRAFALDQVLERRAIRPASVFYAHAVPSFVRARLRSAFSNLGEPIVLINDVLQGRPATAGHTFARLAVNTTFGLAGFFDVAARQLPHHDNGFGVTMGRYGVRSGPYVYLPVLGPSTFRDLAGSGVDIALNPLTWIRYPKDYIVGPVSTITGGLDRRAQADGDLKALAAQSTDEYATLRSAYLQNRQAQITGEQVDVNALPSFDDPAAGPVTTPAAPGSTAPSAGALEHPQPSQPNAPAGAAGALPAPATPAPSAPASGPQARLAPREAETPIATMAMRAEPAPRPVLLAALR